MSSWTQMSVAWWPGRSGSRTMFLLFWQLFPKFTTATSTSEKIHTRYKNTNVYNKQDFSPAVQSTSQMWPTQDCCFKDHVKTVPLSGRDSSC